MPWLLRTDTGQGALYVYVCAHAAVSLPPSKVAWSHRQPLLCVCVCACLQVKYIVSCIAASEYLGNTTKMDDWAVSQWDISVLFGAVPLKHPNIKKGKVNGMPPTVFNKVSQVNACACSLEDCVCECGRPGGRGSSPISPGYEPLSSRHMLSAAAVYAACTL